MAFASLAIALLSALACTPTPSGGTGTTTTTAPSALDACRAELRSLRSTVQAYEDRFPGFVPSSEAQLVVAGFLGAPAPHYDLAVDSTTSPATTRYLARPTVDGQPNTCPFPIDGADVTPTSLACRQDAASLSMAVMEFGSAPPPQSQADLIPRFLAAPARYWDMTTGAATGWYTLFPRAEVDGGPNPCAGMTF